MDKFMHFVEDKMSPIADKLGEQRHLSAMQKGFMTVLPLIFVGAVFMVIANPPVTADMVKSGGVWSIFSGWFNFATKYKMAILVPYNMSMGLLALAVTFVIADNLATSYSMKGITNGLTALVVFLLVAAPANYLALADGTTPLLMNCTYLGAQGLFTAIIVALLTVEITRFCEIHNITIRLPEICPPALTNSFRTIVPMVINVSIFYILSLLSSNYLGMSILCSWFNILMCIYVVIMVLWSAWTNGYHGTYCSNYNSSFYSKCSISCKRTSTNFSSYLYDIRYWFFRRNRKYSWTMYFILLECKITTIKSFWESDNCA